MPAPEVCPLSQPPLTLSHLSMRKSTHPPTRPPARRRPSPEAMRPSVQLEKYAFDRHAPVHHTGPQCQCRACTLTLGCARRPSAGARRAPGARPLAVRRARWARPSPAACAPRCALAWTAHQTPQSHYLVPQRRAGAPWHWALSRSLSTPRSPPIGAFSLIHAAGAVGCPHRSLARAWVVF
jgi:hypothetical protein